VLSPKAEESMIRRQPPQMFKTCGKKFLKTPYVLNSLI